MNYNILVLDDEKEIADLVEVYLKNENYNVYKFYNSQKALDFKQNRFSNIRCNDARYWWFFYLQHYKKRI